MNNAVLINKHFATAMAAAQNTMQDLRYNAKYAPVFRVCYLEYNAEKVPATGKAIFKAFSAAFNGGPRMPILKTPLNCSCFLGVRGNDVYRALHDYDHFSAYTEGFGTTRLDDEAALNRKMVNRIMANIGGPIDSGLRRAIEVCLLADLVGQSYYYAQRKAFVHNEKQLAFVEWLAGRIDWLGIGVSDTHHDKWASIVFPDFS